MRPLLILLLAAGCDGFSRWPEESTYLDERLWDTDVIAATDGLYAILPHAQKLAYIGLDGAAAEVDLQGAEPLRLTLAPDGTTLLVATRWAVCDKDDRKIKTVSDCPEDDLRYEYALDRVEGGTWTSTLDVPAYLNAFEFSHEGGKAVVWLDYAAYEGEELPSDQLVDLNSVALLDLATETATTVGVGFECTDVVFSEDDTDALVLSRAQAVVVDLDSFEVSVTYPLSLDADDDIEPLAAEFTPDGRYALVSIKGQSDLYKLDLQIESIDILSLSGKPSAMIVDAATDHTLIAYSGQSTVELMDHTYFELTEIELEESVNNIVDLGGSALLYNDSSSSSHDVYRLDLESEELVEYVLTNPVHEVLVADSGALALAVLRPGSGGSSDLEDYAQDRWGIGILDLTSEDATSLTLQSEPVGVVLADRGDTTYALLLLEGEDQLLVVDLKSPSAVVAVDLPAPPKGVGELADGRFYVTHESTFGLLSFLDPTTDPVSVESVGGFATIGVFNDDELPARGVTE